METKPEFTFLHISDMQFGRNHRFGRLAKDDGPGTSFDTLFHRLTTDLHLLSDAGIKPQFIVVSGDLAEWGLKTEFDDSLHFLQRLCEDMQIPRTHVAIVPGNHDINRALCEGYFKNCEGDGEVPTMPYWPKWKHYHSLFNKFYEGIKDISFTESEPWSLYELPELRIVIAATNSTIVESHQEGDHYGHIGEFQLEWFASRLREYEERKWFRIAVVHHNVVRGAVNDEENLRDADDLKRILSPHVNLVLHGHTHKSGLEWMGPSIPVISTGSTSLNTKSLPAEIGNQYQILRVSSTGFERWTRRYEPHRWVGDTSSSENGAEWHTVYPVKFLLAEATFAEQAEASIDQVEENTYTSAPIVSVSERIDPEKVKKRLRELPRFYVNATNQHRAIRRQDQETFGEMLRRYHTGWLVVDWGLGKDGFLATTIERLGGPEALAEVFRLQCGTANSCEELWAAAEPQLGLSLQEFFAAVPIIPNATLIFDDLPAVIASGIERQAFDARIRPVLDFCPDLHLIFVTRSEPNAVDAKNLLALQPLEPEETNNYLKFHEHRRTYLGDSFDLESVHTWSAGLPMHLDRLLERLPFLPLTTILDEDIPVAAEHQSEPLPESLKRTISGLAASTDIKVVQSWRLLKVLTVLRDGETFDSVKRFYRKEPFHTRDIDSLTANRLLEGVSISQTAADLRGTTHRRTLSGAFQPVLLRVPRQVRDHVNTLITDNERDDIIRGSMGLFFGPDWSSGKVKLRTALFNAYGESAIATPGNEHVAARYLLKKSLDSGSRVQSDKLAHVAYSYCEKLHSADRFRDSLIASAAILEILRETPLNKSYVETSLIYAKALRMTDHAVQSVEVLQDALIRGDAFITDEFRANIYLSQALAYQSLKRPDDAVASARQVLSLLSQKAGDSHYANAIIAEYTLTGSRRKTRMIQLEQDARNTGSWHAANNIAIQLAQESKTADESFRWLDTVIRTSKDNYNRARAIIKKASILKTNLRIAEMSFQEQRYLNAAYNYSYGQRIGNLLDQCHDVLWHIATRENLVVALVRLYRFSSLIWRWRGAVELDTVYLKQLDVVNTSDLRMREGSSLDLEIHYLERQRGSQST